MRARAATISATDAHARLPIPPARDEIHHLGTTFNELLQRLQDALEREQQFVTDAGHELRTPLSLLTTELELALRRPRSNPELVAAIRSALDETTRLSRLARDLLTVADAGGSAEPPIIDLHTQLQGISDRYRHALGDQLDIDCPAGQYVRADPNDLDRIISNVIDNATQHGAPPITIRVQRASTDGVEIRVGDHGAGFPPGFLPRAFDQFTPIPRVPRAAPDLDWPSSTPSRNATTAPSPPTTAPLAAPKSPSGLLPHLRSPRQL